MRPENFDLAFTIIRKGSCEVTMLMMVAGLLLPQPGCNFLNTRRIVGVCHQEQSFEKELGGEHRRLPAPACVGVCCLRVTAKEGKNHCTLDIFPALCLVYGLNEFTSILLRDVYFLFYYLSFMG